MKHTKGPWSLNYVGDPNDLWILDGKDKAYLADIYGAHGPEDAMTHEEGEANAELIAQAPAMYDQLASARAIMQKFVDKVDRGMARSIETYAEMKQWMEEE